MYLSFGDPLKELWRLRSAIVAHAGGDYPKEDLRTHYRNLLEQCDKSMRKLAELINKRLLDTL